MKKLCNYPIGCDICLCATEEEITHLSLYLIGSDGINVCLDCRMSLTENARALRAAASKARRDGFSAGKAVSGITGQ